MATRPRDRVGPAIILAVIMGRFALFVGASGKLGNQPSADFPKPQPFRRRRNALIGPQPLRRLLPCLSPLDSALGFSRRVFFPLDLQATLKAPSGRVFPGGPSCLESSRRPKYDGYLW